MGEEVIYIPQLRAVCGLRLMGNINRFRKWVGGWRLVGIAAVFVTRVSESHSGMLRTVQTLKTSPAWKLHFRPVGGVSLIWDWGTEVLAEGDAWFDW